MTPPGLDRIVKNAAPLAEEAVPDAWPGRSEQLRELLDIVNEGMSGRAERAAVIYSLISTCKLLGIEPFAYLRDVLERLPTHPADRIAELTPRLWQAARPAAVRS